VALDYTKAPTVTIGSPIDSRHWNKLADAFNDRFLGGVGDPTYRLHWYLHSIFRNLRNPSWPLFAAEDEWWKFYSHIEPLEYDYPAASAGDPEGINVNNPLGTFVFGNDHPSLDIYNEPDRINYDPTTGDGIVLHDDLGAPVSDLDHWEIGKYQRGVTDSAGTDLDQANAIVAAQHHIHLRGDKFLHKGYGGFLPIPGSNGICENGYTTDITLKFTKLSDSSECTYSSCEEGSGSGSCDNVSKGVYSWGLVGKNYYIIHWDGTITVLPVEDYVEGPYTGLYDDAFLGRRDGDQLSRILNFYINDFRGSDTNRALSDYFVEDYAFDFQRFFTRQYFLAPAYGVASGYGDGSLDAVYTQFDFNSDTAAGYGTTGGSDNYDIHDGFVCASFIAVGDSLAESKTFTLSVGGKDCGSVTIDGTTVDKSIWFEFPKNGNVKIRCDKAMGASESAYCEIAEILEMMPANEDAYIVLRMGSANGTSDDGDGHDTASPKNISDNMWRHGMIYNGSRSGVRDEDTYINRNPIYMTARKVSHDRTRLIERISLKGYEVSGGKSILYYERKARGVSGADIFQGIAPSEDEITSGAIRHNTTYIVESGTTGIIYDSNSIAVGTTFVGAKGVNAFSKSTGDEVVKEHDGIISTPGEGGYDNLWSMFLTTTGYDAAEGSEFKPESYGDVIGWGHDRCVTFSHDWSEPSIHPEYAEINPHVTGVGGSVLARSENPTGYRYLLGSHTPPTDTGGNNLISQSNGSCDGETESGCEGVIDHYKSCQIYVPDYKIESVVMAGSQVKVTLEGRLSRNDSAPSTVTNSSAGWDSYLATETGARSDENAVVEYLRWDQGSGTKCTLRIGDVATDVDTVADRIYGSGACLPRFYLTRLIPKVYEDSNNIYEPHDTPVVTDELAWMDLVLRAICEGFVDEDSSNGLRKYWNAISLKYDCYDKRLFDYTYENLMYKANNNRWPRIVPLSERPDNPKMFGPLPMVFTYAEHFNQISKAVNLLNRARLYLPVKAWWRRHDYEGILYLNSIQGDGNCYNGAVWGEDMLAPEATTLTSTGAWDYEVGSFTLLSFQRAKIDDVSGNCIIRNRRRDIEYYIELSGLANYALPDDLRTLIEDDKGVGFAAAVDIKADTHRREVVEEGDGWGAGGSANGSEEDYQDSIGQFQNWEPIPESETVCEIVNSGTLTADRPPVSDYIDTLQGSWGEGSATERNLVVNNIEAFVRVPLV
jgi:hypothetical protein